jgi:hypothetical protein
LQSEDRLIQSSTADARLNFQDSLKKLQRGLTMSDHVDLYRRMLWDAQKVEDKKLARLVQKRLTPHLDTGRESSTKIITFPAAPVFCTEIEPDIFWKKQQFWQGLVQFFIFLGITGAWAFLPFIKCIALKM